MQSAGAMAFWRYALWLYAKPGVKDTSHRLQDEFGLDVNLLLFCLWAAAAGYGALPPARLQAALNALDPWRAHVIAPLRSARRALKTLSLEGGAGAEELRVRILNEEIETEKLGQALIIKAGLDGLSNDQSPSADAAKDNLLLYCRLADVDSNEDAIALVDALWRLVFVPR